MNKLTSIVLAAAAGCATGDDLDTGLVESEASVWQWMPDVHVPEQRSDSQVGLATFNNRLHMVVRGAGNTTVRWSYFDGANWTTPRDIAGARADYGPALTMHDGRLRTIYHAAGQNRLMMATLTNSTWSSPVTAGSSIGSGTILNAPATVSHLGVLYAGYCLRTSAGDRVRIDWFDGTTWQLAADYDAVFRCKHVTIASLPNGIFDVLSTAESGNTGLWYMQEWRGSGAPSSSWSGTYAGGMKSKKPMSVVTCNGLTHLVHGGNSSPNEIWWTTREGGQWLGDARVPDQASTGGTTLGCLGTRTFMVHNGGDSQLWWSEYGE